VTDLSYTPTFDPTDWIDNVSRISGDGPNGFNVRFDAIASDLHEAAAAVTRIDSALDRPVGTPTGQQLLTPGLDLVTQVDFVGGGWTYDKTGAAHPNFGDAEVVAVMGLSLPTNVRLASFRAIGLYAGSPTTLSVALIRTPVANASVTPDTLAEISSGTSALTNPYDVTLSVDSRFSLVDPGTYRYCVVARAAFVRDVTATSLVTVQLAYTAT
jgi:hypothetical protein